MELAHLIAALSDPGAYPHQADGVEVHQTHISVVFLAGPYAYKIKKPVDLGFLDYSTLEKRHGFCRQEVLLNRRLAASVYLDVVPVIQHEDVVRMEGQGKTIEWAVKMTRLPEEATMREQVRRGVVGIEQVRAVAGRLARFHASAEANSEISAGGRFAVVARNARENFEQSRPQVGTTVSRAVFERLSRLTEAALTRQESRIENRAARGVPRDTHGDLRLGHVYLFPEAQPPDDLLIVDCIEFNARFRHADPIADMAFLAMDLERHGRPDLEDAFVDAYFEAADDSDGRPLLAFYAAYRAAVRGKVEGITYTEPEVAPADRSKALVESRAHWLLALSQLEEPDRRPCLLLVGGLPGTGKSTLSRTLVSEHGFTLVRSDAVRKEIANLGEAEVASSPYGTGIYSPEWNERTYAECLRRAEQHLFEGKRVVVDASFGNDARRIDFLETGICWGVPSAFLCCLASSDVVRSRLEARVQDASDADWSVYLEAAARWEPPGPGTRRSLRTISTDDDRGRSVAQVARILRELRLED